MVVQDFLHPPWQREACPLAHAEQVISRASYNDLIGPHAQLLAHMSSILFGNTMVPNVE